MTRVPIVLVTAFALVSCAPATRVSTRPSPSIRQSMPHLLPLPSSIEIVDGDPFVVTPTTTIRFPSGTEDIRRLAVYLSRFIGTSTDPKVLPIGEESRAVTGDIQLEIGDVRDGGDEAYELMVKPDRVVIKGRTAAGVFYGIQTFRQLLPPVLEHQALRPDKNRPIRAPAVTVVDSPRFEWRGAMLDVARHFLTVDDVKRY